MGLLLVDGWDGYTTLAGLTAKGWTYEQIPVIDPAYKRTGLNGIRLYNAAGITVGLNPATAASGYYGAGMMTADGTDNWRVEVGNGEGQQLHFIWDAGLQALICRLGNFNSGTILCQAAGGSFPVGQWFGVGFQWTIANSGGTVELFQNGVSVASSGPTDTQARTSATWTYLTIQSYATAAVHVDDCYIGDLYDDLSASPCAAYLGDQVVDTAIAQAGNGANVGWTPSAGGDHGEMVNDLTPDDDATYNATSTVSAIDSYTIAGLSGTGAIAGVQVSVVADKTGAEARTVAGIVRITAANYTHGTARSPSLASFANHHFLWHVSPATSAVWTPAELTEIGQVLVS